MTSHETDARYTSSEARSRIAALYLPLLNIVMNAPLHCFDQEHYLLDDYQGKTILIVHRHLILIRFRIQVRRFLLLS